MSSALPALCRCGADSGAVGQIWGRPVGQLRIQALQTGYSGVPSENCPKSTLRSNSLITYVLGRCRGGSGCPSSASRRFLRRWGGKRRDALFPGALGEASFGTASPTAFPASSSRTSLSPSLRSSSPCSTASKRLRADVASKSGFSTFTFSDSMAAYGAHRDPPAAFPPTASSTAAHPPALWVLPSHPGARGQPAGSS